MKKTILKSISVFLLAVMLNSCEKDKPEPKIADIDGNEYGIITIGTQVWMKENLKTTKYSDGSPIENVTDEIQWSSKTTGAYCLYNNQIGNKNTYGALYNFYAVDDSRNICPAGWHVATDADWTELVTFLGGDTIAGGKLKSVDFWDEPNTGADNSSKFNALPGGLRYGPDGIYYNIGGGGYWWMSDDVMEAYAMCRQINYGSAEIEAHGNQKECGLSVRCIKDN